MARSHPISPKRAVSVAAFTSGELIGDGLFKLPFVARLRTRFPDAHITWLTAGSTVYAGPLRPAVGSLVDEIVETDQVGRSIGDLFRLERPLDGRRFDVLIDTQKVVPRTLSLRRIRHGLFISAAADFLLSDRRPPRPYRQPKHLIDRLQILLDLARPRPPDEPPHPRLAIDERYLAQARALLPDGPTYVGFVPGAGDRGKMWPLDRFLELARRQLAAGRVPVFFCGPAEEAWVPAIRAALPQARLPQWDPPHHPARDGPVLGIALATRLAAAVANDSGGGHIVAAGNAPMVLLFAWADPEKYAPMTRRLRIVDAKSYGGWEPARIPLERVAAELEVLLQEGPAPEP